MKQISNKGNLPKTMQLLLGNFPGTSTDGCKIFECNKEEILNLAKEKKCELTPPLVDVEYERYFLTGFEVETSPLVTLNNTSYEVLIIYFAEINKDESKKWDKLIKLHRDEQQIDSASRKNKGNLNNFK